MKNALSALGFIALLTSNVFAFNDVKNTNKNKQAIEYLQSKEIIKGYEDGTFKPEKEINRAEMLKILVEGKGVKPTLDTFKNCFPDVKEEWFAPYVCYAKFRRWVGGYPDGTFKPSQTVSKVESLKMILNAFEVPLSNVAGSTFSDVNTGDWFAPYVRTAKEKGLLEETSIKFDPATSQSRAKVSENLFRTMVVKEKNADKFSDELINEIAEKVVQKVITEQKETLDKYDERIEEVEKQIDENTTTTLIECPITDGKGVMRNDICTLVSCNSGYEAKNNKCELKNQSCDIENGIGTQIWNLAKEQFEDCEIICNSGYHYENSSCVKNERDCNLQGHAGKEIWNNNMWKSCTVSECTEGFHVENGRCEEAERECYIKFGKGIQYWDKNWSNCAVVSCNSEYHKEGKLCVNNKKDCNITNGTGEMIWTDSWEECKPTSCNEYYLIVGNECKKPDRQFTGEVGLVYDHKNELTWIDFYDWEHQPHHLIKKFCDNLNQNGYTDWRLPTVEDVSHLTGLKDSDYEAFKLLYYYDGPVSLWRTFYVDGPTYGAAPYTIYQSAFKEGSEEVKSATNLMKGRHIIRCVR